MEAPSHYPPGNDHISQKKRESRKIIDSSSVPGKGRGICEWPIIGPLAHKPLMTCWMIPPSPLLKTHPLPVYDIYFIGSSLPTLRCLFIRNSIWDDSHHPQGKTSLKQKTRFLAIILTPPLFTNHPFWGTPIFGNPHISPSFSGFHKKIKVDSDKWLYSGFVPFPQKRWIPPQKISQLGLEMFF